MPASDGPASVGLTAALSAEAASWRAVERHGDDAARKRHQRAAAWLYEERNGREVDIELNEMAVLPPLALVDKWLAQRDRRHARRHHASVRRRRRRLERAERDCRRRGESLPADGATFEGVSSRDLRRYARRRAVRRRSGPLAALLRRARPRGAGRPRASASRSGARSGDSGDDSGEPGPPAGAPAAGHAESPARRVALAWLEVGAAILERGETGR